MTIEELDALERSWQWRVPPDDPLCCDWQPYDLGGFAVLLEQVLPYVPQGRQTFLDVGCGIGTKCLVAAQYGLAASGVERVSAYAAAARELGVSVTVADARTWDGYGDYGLVYLNHPLICGEGCNDEAALERRVQDMMSPGAILLSVNYDLMPGCPAHPATQPCDDSCGRQGSWEVVLNGTRRWDAAWRKPLWRSSRT